MNRFTGTVEKLCDVDVSDMVKWIKAIPLTEWPQQSTTELKPSMQTNLDWHGFREQAVAIVKALGFELSRPGTGMGRDETYQWMLSVVMPGHHIEPHKDQQPDYWMTRIHVPLTGNPKAYTRTEDGKYVMKVGSAYKVNVLRRHAVVNEGKTPRIHFMFDVRA